MDKKSFKKYSALIFLVLIILTTAVIILVKKSSTQKIDINSENIIINTLTADFSVKANITVNDTLMVADIVKESGVFEATLSEPQTLNGMVFTYDGDNVTVSYKDMKTEIDASSPPAVSLTGSVVSALKYAAEHTFDAVYSSKGELIINGEADSGPFSLSADCKSGSPLRLELQKLNLQCEFSDFKIIS